MARNTEPFLGVLAQPHWGALGTQEGMTYPSAQPSSSGSRSGSSGRRPGPAPGSQSTYRSPPSWWRAAARARPQWPAGVPPRETEPLTWWGPGGLAHSCWAVSQGLRDTWALRLQGLTTLRSTQAAPWWVEGALPSKARGCWWDSEQLKGQEGAICSSCHPCPGQGLVSAAWLGALLLCPFHKGPKAQPLLGSGPSHHLSSPPLLLPPPHLFLSLVV